MLTMFIIIIIICELMDSGFIIVCFLRKLVVYFVLNQGALCLVCSCCLEVKILNNLGIEKLFDKIFKSDY